MRKFVQFHAVLKIFNLFSSKYRYFLYAAPVYLAFVDQKPQFELISSFLFLVFFTLLFPKKKRTRFERFNLHCKVRYIDSFDTLFRPNVYKNSMFYIPNETKKKRIVRLVTHSGHLNFHVSFFRCRCMDIFFAFSGRK